MVSLGLLIHMKARPGREHEVRQFLASAPQLVADETGTPYLFSMRFGDGSFGIVNAFPDEAARQRHIGGHAAQALSELAAAALDEPPTVEPFDIVAAKPSS